MAENISFYWSLFINNNKTRIKIVKIKFRRREALRCTTENIKLSSINKNTLSPRGLIDKPVSYYTYNFLHNLDYIKIKLNGHYFKSSCVFFRILLACLLRLMYENYYKRTNTKNNPIQYLHIPSLSEKRQLLSVIYNTIVKEMCAWNKRNSAQFRCTHRTSCFDVVRL